MNHMEEIAKMLNINFNEEFEIQGYTDKYILNEDGLFTKSDGNYCFAPLVWLLTGKLKIKHRPWKPEHSECFCYIDQNGRCRSYGFDDDAHSLNYYKLGNCYDTKAEAEIDREKWISFYASDEVLEV